MCRWRHVRNVYLKCGHAENIPDEVLQCDSPRCKFSPNHPSNCKPPSCTMTCAQYRAFPEKYSPNINAYCPTCSQARRQ